MENKDLLTPRYIVTHPYPNSPFEVGDIITEDTDTNYWLNQSNQLHYPVSFDKFPNIFRALSWWEFREMGDMPDYVQLTGVVRRAHWKWDEQEKCYLFRSGFKNGLWEPSTESEYLTYKNAQK